MVVHLSGWIIRSLAEAPPVLELHCGELAGHAFHPGRFVQQELLAQQWLLLVQPVLQVPVLVLPI